MLRQLGLLRIRLLTNNPEKLASLAAHGIDIAGRASLLFAANGVNDRYMQTKANRFGHLPSEPGTALADPQCIPHRGHHGPSCHSPAVPAHPPRA